MRTVRVATASFLIEDTPHTVAINVARGLEYVKQAARAEAQIVCLPETFTTFNVPRDKPIFEDYPGEWTQAFSDAAGENSIAVIAPYYVRENGEIYNQATLFADDGSIVGYYRKVQPTGREARFTSVGDALPVFDLLVHMVGGDEFVRVAIMICMDIYFAEIPRIYAMKGVELLFWPTITHGPTRSGLEAQLRTRAMDNSLWIIESNLAGYPPYAPYAGRFYPGTARIVDPNGDIVAWTGRRHGLAIHDIDLDEQRVTEDVFLINDRDDTRRDLEALVRLDFYAKEYADLAEQQNRFYDSLRKPNAD